MIRITTPKISLNIKNVDLTAADSVYVSIKQGDIYVELTGEDLEVTSEISGGVTESKICFFPTQEDTNKFSLGSARVQVNWLYTEGGNLLRGATKAISIPIDENIMNRVVLE